MLDINEIERFITKYGEKHRKWVLGAHEFWCNEWYPKYGPFSKLDEVQYLLNLKKRARP